LWLPPLALLKMNNKILIFGKGFIGTRLKEEFNCASSGKKILSLSDAENEIKKYKPKIIINCIGTSGRDVDDCELDKDKTLLANSFVPVILAETALLRKIKLVHISSGCIYHFDYNVQKPVTEEIAPDFYELFYSRSKIYSERAVEVLAKQYNMLIIRIRIPLDDRPHPKNLLNKLIKYGKVITTPNSITYIPDFINALKHLLRIDASGIYNIVNNPPLRYPDLMEAYRGLVPDFRYKTIDFKDLKLVRTNLVLSAKKLEKSGFKMRNMKKVLKDCIPAYIQNSRIF